MDRETWQRVRPALLATLIPVAAGVGFLLVATYAKKTPSLADRPSMAAFDACLTDNNLQPQPSYPTPFDAQVAARQEMQTCGSKIPQAVIRKWQAQAQASQSSFGDCMHNMGGSPHGFGRFRDFSGMRNAYEICRSLIQGQGGGSAPAKPPGKPVAPVA